MTTLSLSQVSKQFKVNRSTIYRAVGSGRLSRLADGSFDLAEVIRCFGEPVAKQQPVQQTMRVESDDQTKVIELLQRELEAYRQRERDYRDKESRYLDQLDRMQTLLEMKSQPVADAASQRQSHTTTRDRDDATHKSLEDKGVEHNATVHETLQQQAIGTKRNAAHAAVQHSQKRKGLFGRLVEAVLQD